LSGWRDEEGRDSTNGTGRKVAKTRIRKKGETSTNDEGGGMFSLGQTGEKDTGARVPYHEPQKRGVQLLATGEGEHLRFFLGSRNLHHGSKCKTERR